MNIKLRHTLAAVAMLLAMVMTDASAQKLNGGGDLRFGWKYDRCIKAIGDAPRLSETIDGSNPGQRKYTYGPATWEGINFDGSVLDFYKDKLYQIGYSHASATADRTTFDAIVRRLVGLYGKPRRIKADNPDKLIWRTKNGNMAMAEYTYTDADNTFHTYLILIDNEATIKKAKDRQQH